MTSRLRRFALNDSGWLLLLGVSVAHAADSILLRAIENDWRGETFWWTFIAVQVLWAIGYLSSSLPKWAKWTTADTEGRLTVIAGALCALIAGNTAYYMGYYEMGFKTLYCLFGAIGGGFLGEKYLTPLFQKLLPTPTPTTATPKTGGKDEGG